MVKKFQESNGHHTQCQLIWKLRFLILSKLSSSALYSQSNRTLFCIMDDVKDNQVDDLVCYKSCQHTQSLVSYHNDACISTHKP